MTATAAPVSLERLPPLRPATVALRYQPQSASAARRMVRGKLLEWDLGALVESAELVVSELVGNAVKTGCLTLMTVSVRRIALDGVRISVRDGSRVLPSLIVAGDNDESHRGLALLHFLTKGQWGASLETYGKTVHADLEVA